MHKMERRSKRVLLVLWLSLSLAPSVGQLCPGRTSPRLIKRSIAPATQHSSFRSFVVINWSMQNHTRWSSLGSCPLDGLIVFFGLRIEGPPARLRSLSLSPHTRMPGWLGCLSSACSRSNFKPVCC